jgi:hypothetical protein
MLRAHAAEWYIPGVREVHGRKIKGHIANGIRLKIQESKLILNYMFFQRYSREVDIPHLILKSYMYVAC